jgi:hypothetical protein
MGSGGIASLILNLDRPKWSVSRSDHYNHRKEPSVPLEGRLCGPQECHNAVKKRMSGIGKNFK